MLLFDTPPQALSASETFTPLLKMVVKHKVEGFEAFVAKAEELSADKSKTLIVMFSGTKDENGKSWCPDCVVAEPVVDECLAGDPK